MHRKLNTTKHSSYHYQVLGKESVGGKERNEETR